MTYYKFTKIMSIKLHEIPPHFKITILNDSQKTFKQHTLFEEF